VGNLELLPFATGSYDAVVCNDVVEHLEEPGRVFGELLRVLRPSGTLILRTTSVRAPATWLARFSPLWLHRRAKRLIGVAETSVFPTYFRCNTPSALLKVLQKVGFGCVEMSVVDETFGYFSFHRVAYVAGLHYSRFVHRWLPWIGNVILATGVKRDD
jgi:SAM-dependent methyltransferase